MTIPDIVQLRSTDAQEVGAMHRRCFPGGYSDDGMQALLSRPATRAWGMRSHALLSGFLIVQIVPPEAEIISIAVAPETRETGVGSALLADFMTNFCRSQSITAIYLEVAADNTAALCLYTKAGFEPYNSRSNYYSNSGNYHVDAILMRLDL